MEHKLLEGLQRDLDDMRQQRDALRTQLQSIEPSAPHMSLGFALTRVQELEQVLLGLAKADSDKRKSVQDLEQKVALLQEQLTDSENRRIVAEQEVIMMRAKVKALEDANHSELLSSSAPHTPRSSVSPLRAPVHRSHSATSPSLPLPSPRPASTIIVPPRTCSIDNTPNTPPVSSEQSDQNSPSTSNGAHQSTERKLRFIFTNISIKFEEIAQRIDQAQPPYTQAVTEAITALPAIRRSLADVVLDSPPQPSSSKTESRSMLTSVLHETRAKLKKIIHDLEEGTDPSGEKLRKYVGMARDIATISAFQQITIPSTP
ncbi:hypothetical protein Pelo_1471 [Pelomyxa schiedti]|nr:hypothetical protein Pelo_1471 [Pelomyxa schiedti]